MKTRRILGILSVLIVLPINAQLKTGLYIDSYSGAVQIKVLGASSWTQPSHKQSITRLDSLRVPKYAQMTLVDAASGVVYSCNFTFAGNVSKFIQQVKEEKSHVLLELAAQLKANVLGKNSNAVHPVYGGATRAEDDEHYIDSIACLALAIAHASNTPYPNLTLRTRIENGIVRFIIQNDDQKAYFVNVMIRNTQTDEIALGVVPEPDMEPDILLLPAGKSLDLSMYPFLEQSDRQYILFATESPFVPAAIQPLLLYPEDINCK